MMKAAEDPLLDFFHLTNYVFGDAKKQNKWRDHQRSVQSDPQTHTAGVLLAKLRKQSASTTTREQDKLLDKMKGLCKAAVTEAHKDAIANAKTFGELCSLMSAAHADMKSTLQEAVAIKRAPRIYDTRFVSMLDCAEHFEERVAMLYSYMATGIGNAYTPPTFEKLAVLLKTVGSEALQDMLTEFVRAAAPVRAALSRYSNAQAPGTVGSATIYAEVEELIDILQRASTGDGLAARVSKTFYNGLQSRWRESSETGRGFYLSVRQLTPEGYETLEMLDDLLPREDLGKHIGFDVTAPMYQAYTSAVSEHEVGSERVFWKRQLTNETLKPLAERVLFLLTLPPSCTAPDSALSVMMQAIPVCRSAMSRDSHAKLSLLAINQDVRGAYGKECGFRRTFPSLRVNDAESDDEE